jgi:hypothetical protein
MRFSEPHDSTTQPLDNLPLYLKEGKMSRFIRTIATVFCFLLTGLVARAWAAPAPLGAPEIDPGAASCAIGLLTCAVLILTAKRPKKQGRRRT